MMAEIRFIKEDECEMQETTNKLDIKRIQQSWSVFDSVAHLSVIRTQEQYDKTVLLMNELLDVIGDDELHPLANLLEIVGEIVSTYEMRHLNIEPTEPKEVLRYLLELKNLNK